MNPFAKHSWSMCVLALAAVLAGVAVGLVAGETPKSVRVIYTNDLLGNIEPCG